MTNKTIYYRKTKSDSLLGGWKMQKVVRKAHNRKGNHAQRFFTNDRCWTFGMLIGTMAGSLYLQTLGQDTIHFINSASAQETSDITFSTQPEQTSEGVGAAVILDDAGQTQSPQSSLTEKQQIMMYIVEKFGDRAHQAIAMLAKCENSKLDPYATNYNRNGTVDRGIFQINSIHGGEELFNWKTNIDKAYEIYAAHNNTFYSWSCGDVAGDYTYKMKLQGK